MIRYISGIYSVLLALVLTFNINSQAEPTHENQDITRTYAYSVYGTPKYPQTASHLDYVNPLAPKGGTITLPAFGSFDSLNPYSLKGISPLKSPGLGMYNIGEGNETLMAGTSDYLPSGDEIETAYCLVCEYIEYPADKSWVLFKLNSKARFHNGDSITADDVIYSYKLLLSPQAHPIYRSNYANVTKAEKKSALEVLFHLQGDDRKRLILRLGELPVMSKHYWAGKDFGKDNQSPQPLSGPYKISKFKFGSYIEYERVPEHWAKDHFYYQGQFNFDRVRVEFYRDHTVAFESFKSGDTDVFIEYIAKNWASSYDFPAIQTGQIIKEEIPHQIPSGTQAFFFNTRKTLFKDVRVRKALTYLFDFEWTNKNIFASAYKRSNSYFPNSPMAAAGLPTEQELALLEPFRDSLPAALFTEAFELPKTRGDGNIRPQMRQALSLFRQAGWQIKQKQLVNNKTGQPFKLINKASVGYLPRTSKIWKKPVSTPQSGWSTGLSTKYDWMSLILTWLPLYYLNLPLRPTSRDCILGLQWPTKKAPKTMRGYRTR